MRSHTLTVAALFLSLTTFAFGQGILIDGFEDVGAWSAAGNDVTTNGATAELTASTATTEGTQALQISYEHSGNQWYEVSVERTFATPIDMSNALEFQIDVMGDAVAHSDLLWYMLLTDSHGRAIRLVDTSDNAFPINYYKRRAFSIAEAEWSLWTASALDQPDLTEIIRVQFIAQIRAGISVPATPVFTIDNFRYLETSDRMTSTVIEDFEYADSASLQAAWVGFGSAGTVAVDLAAPAAVADGSGALSIDLDMTLKDTRLGAIRTLAEPLDVTQFDVLRIRVLGGPDATGGYNRLYVALEDSHVERGIWYIADSSAQDAYQTVLLYPVVGPWADINAFPTEPMLEDRWDASELGNVDLTDIVKILIYYVDGDGASATYPTLDTPYSVDYQVDSLEGFTSLGLPPDTSLAPVTPVGSWTLYN